MLVLSNKTKDDDATMHQALCVYSQIHLFLGVFFATIISQPLLEPTDEAAVGSVNEGVTKALVYWALYRSPVLVASRYVTQLPLQCLQALQ